MRHAAGRYCYNSEYNLGIFQIKFQGWRSYVFLRQKGSRNMWYVIQTVTGKEEELIAHMTDAVAEAVGRRFGQQAELIGPVFAPVYMHNG